MARRWCPVGPVTEAILALLCALGAALLLWLLLGWLVRPASVHNLWTVIPGRGDGDSLEAALRQLAWLRRAGLFRGEAVIWDEALDREGRQLALRLALLGLAALAALPTATVSAVLTLIGAIAALNWVCGAWFTLCEMEVALCAAF